MNKTHEKAEALIKELESVDAKEIALINEAYLKMKPFQDQLELKIKPIQEDADKKIKPLANRREEIKAELLAIGNKELEKLNAKEASLFVDDNWKFEGSQTYLHVTRETTAEPDKDFELWKFVKKFGDYVEVKFKFKELKKIFVDTKLAKPFIAAGFKLKTVPSVEIKVSKK
jgi:glutamyl/glutaminyl-tRNA synthetase